MLTLFSLLLLTEEDMNSLIQKHINSVKDSKIKNFLKSISDSFWITSSSKTSVTFKYDAELNSDIQRFAKQNNLDSKLLDSYHLKTVIPVDPKFKIILMGSKGKGNKNSGGKALADAAELATVQALKLKNDVKTPDELGIDYFIKDSDAFLKWKNTFNQTRAAVKTLVGSLTGYTIIHKGTDKSAFSKVLNDIVKNSKPLVSSADAWCPADIFIVKTAEIQNITKELQDILKTFEEPNNLLLNANAYIYKLWQDKQLYPISLKQISKTYKIDYENTPDRVIPTYDFKIDSYGCDLSLNSKEIGTLFFINTETNKKVSMQIRGFPHRYSIVQTEITSDGSATGGRLGKIPVNIIDSVMRDYNFERIKSIDYFGKSEFFSNFSDAKASEVWKQYQDVVKNSRNKSITRQEFDNAIESAKQNADVAATMCIKIQGLRILWFFVKNQDFISDIISRMVNGAKKIGEKSAFFIKIY